MDIAFQIIGERWIFQFSSEKKGCIDVHIYSNCNPEDANYDIPQVKASYTTENIIGLCSVFSDKVGLGVKLRVISNHEDPEYCTFIANCRFDGFLDIYIGYHKIERIDANVMTMLGKWAELCR